MVNSDQIHVEINVGHVSGVIKSIVLKPYIISSSSLFSNVSHVLYSIISDVDNYIIIIQFSKPCC